MARAAAASALETLGARTCFRATSRPELGLEANVEFGYRVYVISCVGGRQYVGVETKHRAAERVRRHFSGGAAHYTKTFAPAELLLFWSAACAAVESYVSSALLACQPARQLSRLGGWTQTSSSPSAHACMVFEEQRRALRGDCFNCGGSHYAARCEQPHQGCTYPCPQCGSSILVTARGETFPQRVARSVAPAPPSQVSAAATPAVGVKRRAASCDSESRRPKVVRAAAGTSGAVVSVCGKSYTSLSWFMHPGKPTERQCLQARDGCGHNALALRSGDVRSLVAQGFTACPPALPKPLMGSRQRLPSSWANTSCLSVRSADRGREPVELSRPGERHLALFRANHILWLVSDLEKTFTQ